MAFEYNKSGEQVTDLLALFLPIVLDYQRGRLVMRSSAALESSGSEK